MLRLFVSSTFADFEAERRHLHDVTFKCVAEHCQRLGVSCRFIDLRWGVSEAASQNNLTVEVCLEEVDRCRRLSDSTQVIALVGDRYGWQPAPAKIPGHDFMQLRAACSEDGRELLSKWYGEDANSYCRDHGPECHERYLKTPSEVAPASPTTGVPQQLVEVLAGAAERVFPDERARTPYGGSATELEIERALMPSTTPPQLIVCQRRITNLDDLVRAAATDQRARAYLDWHQSSGQDSRQCTKQRELVERLRARQDGIVLRTYEAHWTTRGLSAHHLVPLAQDVEELLLRGVDAGCERARARRVARTPAQEEAEAQAAFARERAAQFIGRTAAVAAVRAYLEEDRTSPLVVYGPPGIGKSALLAHVVGQLRQSEPSTAVVSIFVGATARSGTGIGLLRTLGEQLNAQGGTDQDPLPVDLLSLRRALPNWLERASEQRKLCVFVDGIDQTSQASFWLPNTLPRNVRLVVSVAGLKPPEPIARALPDAAYLELEPLSVAELGSLFASMLEAGPRRRQVTDSQHALLLSAVKPSGSPLMLRLAAEVARSWRSDTRVAPETFGTTIDQQIRALFSRLGRDENHGDTLVLRVAGWLALSRHGVAESELIELLSRDPAVREDVSRRIPKAPDFQGAIPDVILSRLLLDLEPYLIERRQDATLLRAYFHPQFARTLVGLLSAQQYGFLRRSLGEYFADQDRFFGDTPNLRLLSEATLQLREAKDWCGLDALSSDIRVHLAACAAQRVIEHEEDLAASVERTDPAPNEASHAWRQFFERNRHLLLRGTDRWRGDKILMQLAWEESPSSPVHAAAHDHVQAMKEPPLWLTRFGELNTELHPSRVCSMGYAIDGVKYIGEGWLLAWSAEDAGAWNAWTGERLPFECRVGPINGLEPLAGARVAAFGREHSFDICNRESGVVLQTMTGHTGAVRGVRGLDDDRILSWSDDGSLCSWNMRSGAASSTPTSRHRWFSQSVAGTLRLRDGSVVAWAGNELAFGRVDDERASRHWMCEEGLIRGALELRDGAIASWTSEPSIWLLSVQTDEPAREVRGHTKGVRGLVESSQGWLVSWADDRDLCVWNTADSKPIAKCTAHELGLQTAILLSNGDIISCGDDGTIRAWHLPELGRVAEIEAHAGRVLEIVQHDEHTLLTRGDDGSIAIWNWPDGKVRARIPQRALPQRIFTIDGDRFAVAGRQGDLSVWKLSALESSPGESPHKQPIVGAVCVDEDRVVTWSYGVVEGEPHLGLWEIDKATTRVLAGHKADVKGAIVSEHGELVSFDEAGELRVWNLAAGSSVILGRHDRKQVAGVQVTPLGLLSWAHDGALALDPAHLEGARRNLLKTPGVLGVAKPNREPRETVSGEAKYTSTT